MWKVAAQFLFWEYCFVFWYCVFAVCWCFNLSPVSLTPLVHLELWIFPLTFEKNSADKLSGVGGIWFMNKSRNQKSCDTVPLSTLTKRLWIIKQGRIVLNVFFMSLVPSGLENFSHRKIQYKFTFIQTEIVDCWKCYDKTVLSLKPAVVVRLVFLYLLVQCTWYYLR